MVQLDGEISEAELFENLRDGCKHVSFGEEAVGSGDVHIALIEFTKAAPAGPVSPPHRLDLISLEESGEVSVLCDDPGERNRQVVAQAEVGELALGDLVLFEGSFQRISSVQDAVEKLVALRAVFAKQGGEVLNARGLDWCKTVELIDLADHIDDIAPAQQFPGEEISHAAWGLCAGLGHN